MRPLVLLHGGLCSPSDSGDQEFRVPQRLMGARTVHPVEWHMGSELRLQDSLLCLTLLQPSTPLWALCGGPFPGSWRPEFQAHPGFPWRSPWLRGRGWSQGYPRCRGGRSPGRPWVRGCHRGKARGHGAAESGLGLPRTDGLRGLDPKGQWAVEYELLGATGLGSGPLTSLPGWMGRGAQNPREGAVHREAPGKSQDQGTIP